MKNTRYLLAVLFVVSSVVFLSSCEFVTEQAEPAQFRPASSVVINEVFTLPPTNPAFYCWVEFLNAGTDTVDITNWKLQCYTDRISSVILLAFDAQGNTEFLGQLTIPDSAGVFDVSFTYDAETPAPFPDPVILPPNALYTITSNSSRLQDHTEWGPGDERMRHQSTAFRDPTSFQIDTVFSSPDSTVVRVISYVHVFALRKTDQLVLKDGLGRVVDVVRYGGYVIQGTDPFPGNVSTAGVPDYESVCRYAGGYFTGNTANDFFITNRFIRPIPHWYSQAIKR